MSLENWDSVKEIFFDAVDLAPRERARLLDERCGADAELRREVEKLLRQDAEADEDLLARPLIEETGADFFAAAVKEADPLIGRRLGKYEIVGEIGRGGMGAVYLARRADGAFERRAAIKIVRRGMDTRFILARFRQERQILAALDHPFVARLLDGGTTDDGTPYFVMEYVDGSPLFEYCRSRNLDVRERLKIFRQICEAVDYAHRKRIVHRDLKPSNILVKAADATPRLLDFGIAKVFDEKLKPNSTIDPTATVMRLMTPEYAAPEQIKGETVSPATDVYALGIVLYELLTNERPFRFASREPREIARVVCEQNPASIADLKLPIAKEIVGDLEAIIYKSLRKNPLHRYPAAGELLADLDKYLAGKPVFSTAAQPPKSAPKNPRASSAALKSIAVLPLKVFNLGSESGDDVLSVGLADALITRLSGIRQIFVRPTSLVMRFAGRRVNPFAAGSDLDVDFVVDGTLRRLGRRVRVSAQLLDTKNQATVWAQSFDEEFTDFLALEDSLSGKIADALVPRLTADEKTTLKKRGTENAQAFEAYLRGRVHWNAFTPEGFAKAFAAYTEATALDPGYAEAYVALAEYYIWLSIFGILPPKTLVPPARAAAARAVALDDDLADAHTALGFIEQLSFRWSTAERHFRRALEINPHSPLTLIWYSLNFLRKREFDRGLSDVRRAIEIDARTPFNRYILGWSLYMSRRFDEAVGEYRRAALEFPDYMPNFYGLAIVLRQLRRFDEAFAAVEQARLLSNDSLIVKLVRAQVLAAVERGAEAERMLAEIDESIRTHAALPYHRAIVYALCGEAARALRMLETAIEEQDPWMVWMNIDPAFDALRDDARFRRLLEKMNG